MKNKPDHAGLYWARTRRCKWWNLIVTVSGEIPYLEISFVWNFMDDEQGKPAHIHEFGPEIVEPDPPVLDEEERKS